MENKNGYYDFEQNLLKASQSDNIKESIKEWAEITRKYNCKETCICNRKIKNVVFMFNNLTNNTIMVGTGCFKKFGFNASHKTIHPVLKDILSNFFEKGEYVKINDIYLYCKYVESKLKDYYRTEILCESSIYGLERIKEAIVYLINNEGLKYMEEIISEIDDKINRLRFEREKRREEELEIIRKEEERCEEIKRIDKERELKAWQETARENERIKLEREERKRKEAECLIRQKERQLMEQECGCGIQYGYICNCKNPYYIILKINQELYCNNCKNWKCRCG